MFIVNTFECKKNSATIRLRCGKRFARDSDWLKSSQGILPSAAASSTRIGASSETLTD